MTDPVTGPATDPPTGPPQSASGGIGGGPAASAASAPPTAAPPAAAPPAAAPPAVARRPQPPAATGAQNPPHSPQADRRAARPGMMRAYVPPLLESLGRDSLDPGYAEAAARRAGGSAAPSRLPCLAGDRRRGRPAGRRAALRHRRRCHRVERTPRREDQVRAARGHRPGTNARSPSSLRRPRHWPRNCGQTRRTWAPPDRCRRWPNWSAPAAHRGPLDLDCGSSSTRATPTTRSGVGVIQDRDIQLLVNDLWAAGAEAITVGGVRLQPDQLDPAGRRIDPGRQPAGVLADHHRRHRRLRPLCRSGPSDPPVSAGSRPMSSCTTSSSRSPRSRTWRCPPAPVPTCGTRWVPPGPPRRARLGRPSRSAPASTSPVSTAPESGEPPTSATPTPTPPATADIHPVTSTP